MQNLITVKNAARLLGVTERTIYRYLKHGLLTRFESKAFGVRVSLSEVNAFFKESSDG